MKPYAFRENGGAYINEMIRKARKDGEHSCTVTGNWEIEQAVAIPSEFTLVLDNCHLRMKDGVIGNMFINEHLDCLSPLVKDYDICIEGRGRAILDGGEPNELNERVFKANPEAFPGITHNAVNSILMFAHVDGIRIHGLHIRNLRYWALTFAYCCHGVLRDLDFRSNDSWIDEDGQMRHGFIQGETKYDSICVKNADGIDLRCGCHDFVIENITGFTQDDGVAVNCIWGNVPAAYYAEGDCKDIWNIIIRNINMATYCSNVRLLNGDGNLLHDILIDGVFDAIRGCRFTQIGLGHVKIGDTRKFYRDAPSQPGEVYNITVCNVHSTGKAAPVKVECVVDNLTLKNIHRS